MSEDKLNPAHYMEQGIQPIHVLARNNQLDGFLYGNALKYLMRHESKNGAEDLKKCLWYLKWMIAKKHGHTDALCEMYARTPHHMDEEIFSEPS